ncbi:MAG: hypothetical protein Kow0074_04860 [Candidatus Zixiibacteriota bacterium]
MNRSTRYGILLLLVPLLLAGCYRARQLESLCEDISWQFPEAEFHRDISFSLGSVSLGAVKLAAGFADDTREAREYLSGISRLDVAIYEVSHLDGLEYAEMPERLEELLDDGWEIVVKTKEEDERVWILFREDGEAVRDLHVTVLNPSELVMVRLSGDLNDVFERVMEDHHSLRAAVNP